MKLYSEIKQITKQQNKNNMKKAIKEFSLLIFMMFTLFWVASNLMIYIWNL